jgi:hypothetical protein
LLLVLAVATLAHWADVKCLNRRAQEISFFEAPIIRVTGLPPLHPITISAITGDPERKTAASRARHVPDLAGVVDNRRSIANGDYEGVDPMGVFRRLPSPGSTRWPRRNMRKTTWRVSPSASCMARS